MKLKKIFIVMLCSVMFFGGCGKKETENTAEDIKETVIEDISAGNTVVINKEEADNFVSETAYVLLDDEKYQIADAINEKVEGKVSSIKNEMRESAETTEGTPPIAFLYNAYGNVYETENIISVVLDNGTYSGGAHGYHWTEAFTAYKDGSEVMTLSDLTGIENIDAVKSLIKYEISSHPENYFPDAEGYVDGANIENSFYADGNGNIVIFFNPYEIAPYAAGVVSFKFDADKLQGIIKEDIYDELKKAEEYEKADIRFNGEGCKLKNAPEMVKVNENYSTVFLPLEEILDMAGADIEINGDAEVRNINGVDYVSYSDMKMILTEGAVNVISDGSICIYY